MQLGRVPLKSCSPPKKRDPSTSRSANKLEPFQLCCEGRGKSALSEPVSFSEAGSYDPAKKEMLDMTAGNAVERPAGDYCITLWRRNL